MLSWGNSGTILIADDSPSQLALICRVLTRDGYRCVTARDGRAALDACLTQRIDVVIVDIEMPVCDGLSVCRQIKSAHESCLLPVLVMTGNVDQRAHLEAIEAGADDFLPKPLGIPELRARVRSAIRMKHCIDELDNAAASIVMLGAAIEARDPHTKGHCQRLADYAAGLGRRIGLDRVDLRALDQGGYLHDLGKVAIPDAVLFKPGPLTRSEYELIKSHAAVGDRICAPLRTLERARVIIRSHHELLDGSGYPDGLRGAAVPLVAQITAIADVYDALTTDRPYRRALAPEVAFETLRAEAHAGKRDVALVDEFVSVVVGDESPSYGAGAVNRPQSDIALP
jgi:putative two-component system response regulator